MIQPVWRHGLEIDALAKHAFLAPSLANAEAIGVVAPDVEAVEAGQELAVVPLVG